MPVGGSAIGAGISGFVEGLRARRADDRVAERERREGERYELEQKRMLAFRELADLVETYTHAPQAGEYGASVTPRRVPGQTSMPQAPVPPSAGYTPATAMPPARLPAAVASPAMRGINSPQPEAPAPTPPGPQTDDDRIGFSLWRRPAMFAEPEFLNKAAKIFLKHGMPEGVAWLERGARAERENDIMALRSLVGGDPQGAVEAFNSRGRLKIAPDSLKELGDGRWQFTIEGTGKTQTFDPRRLLRSYLSPREFFDLDRRERTDAAAAANRDRTRTETERHNRATEDIGRQGLDVRREVARVRAERGAETATALQKNVEYLVKAGVAKDAADAFAKLRTAMDKPEEDAILGVAQNLMRGPGYYGKDGAKRATADAREIVRSLRGGRRASTFKSAEDVRAAYRAGGIDRARAMQELQAFGFAPE